MKEWIQNCLEKSSIKVKKYQEVEKDVIGNWPHKFWMYWLEWTCLWESNWIVELNVNGIFQFYEASKDVLIRGKMDILVTISLDNKLWRDWKLGWTVLLCHSFIVSRLEWLMVLIEKSYKVLVGLILFKV